MFFTSSFLGPTNHLELKFNYKLQDVKRVLDLNCKLKEDWTIKFFQVTFKCWKSSSPQPKILATSMVAYHRLRLHLTS